MPHLSIIVPTLNEANALPRLFADLARLPLPHELIVVDGGSRDATVRVAEEAGTRVLHRQANRGLQLAEGAVAARAEMLCFLHADVRLDAEALATLSELTRARRPIPYAFRLGIDARGTAYRLIELAADLRSRAMRLPYGDQGLVIRRDLYRAVGGYPRDPLMEDVIMARKLSAVAPIRLLSAQVRVSPRRWERDGPLRRTIRNQALLARFLLGTPPGRLVRSYSAEHTTDG